MAKHPKTLSGAEFKLHFLELARSLKDDDEVFFGDGTVSLYRVKERGPVEGPRLVQIAFNELYTVAHDPEEG